MNYEIKIEKSVPLPKWVQAEKEILDLVTNTSKCMEIGDSVVLQQMEVPFFCKAMNIHGFEFVKQQEVEGAYRVWRTA